MIDFTIPPDWCVPPPTNPRFGVLASGTELSVFASDLVGGLSILGKNGTGKTVSIINLATADMDDGRGIIVLDPHGDLVSDLLARVPAQRVDDVVLLDAGDPDYAFGINPFWCPNPKDQLDVSRRGDAFHDLMHTIWPDAWGTLIEVALRNTAYTLLHNSPHYTLLDFMKVLDDDAFRARLVDNVPNYAVRAFWQNDYDAKSDAGQRRDAASTKRRIQRFLMNPRILHLFASPKPSVNFFDFMQEKKIVLIRLPLRDLGDENTQLLGSLIVRFIIDAAFARTDLPRDERHQIMLYADEFQRFATPDFATFINEARKTGVTTVIAHQQLAQLPPSVRHIPSATRNRLVFQVSAEDATQVVRDLNPPPPPETRPVRSDALAFIMRGWPDKTVSNACGSVVGSIEYAVAHAEPPANLRQVPGRHTAPNQHQFGQGVIAAVNNWLVTVMTEGYDQAREGQAQLEATISRFCYTCLCRATAIADNLKESIIGNLPTIGQALDRNPIYRTGPDFNPPTPAQLREKLRTELTDYEPLHAFIKLDSLQSPITIRLPERPTRPPVTAERSQRLYYKKRSDIEEAMTAKPTKPLPSDLPRVTYDGAPVRRRKIPT